MRAFGLLFFSLPLWALLTASNAQAFLTISETGEIPLATYYQVGLEPQFLSNNGGGANVSAFFDAPFTDAVEGRLWLGTGVTDFNFGATVKFVPFPDIDNQPAMGIRGGAFFTRVKSDNVQTFQVAPLFSKKVNTEEGLFIPYAAFALDFTSTKDRNYTGTQAVFGSEFRTPEIPRMYFGAEVGFSLNDSYSYVAGTVTFPFDSSKGLFE